MYVYFNKSYEATTVIPHGEILRQGGDLNLYVCFDERLEYNTSLICTIDMNGEKTPLVYITDGYFTFNKIKDSEITYDLIDGKRYWRLYFKATPEVATVYSGKINVSFEINKPDGKNYSATIPLYVEKTFGYSLDKTNLSKDEYEKLWELINTINGTKISYGNGIATKNKTERFDENDENKLFIDEVTGDIFTVKNKNGSFAPKIINFGEGELRDLLEKEFQTKFQFDDVPTEGSQNLVNSGKIFEAIDEIPKVSPLTENNNDLTGLIIDDEEYGIPSAEFEIERNNDGKLVKIKFDGKEYKVDTLEELEKSTQVKPDDEKPVTSDAVYKALEEKSDVEATDENGFLKELAVDGKNYKLPLVDFEIFETEQSGEHRELKAIKVNDTLYVVKGGSGNNSNVPFDSSVTSHSTNAVTSQGIYKALLDKVDVVPGKKLSTNDFTDAYKTKLETIDNSISNAQATASNAQTIASNAQTTANEAKSIAEGRARTHVFETRADMYSALDKNTTYRKGDNLFIKELNVPDYWIYDVHSSTDEDPEKGRYGYYTIAQLETQKVPLTDYPTTKQMNDAIYDAIGYVLTHNVED